MRTQMFFLCVVLSFVFLTGCVSEDDVGDLEIGTMQFALTWEGESIERDDSGSSWTSYYMWTLDSEEMDICGWDGTADYILHYSHSGAYDDQPDLRMDGENYFARCVMNL